ncbi:ketopantoate reductase family protein [Desulfogranum marinum]|uniref:ketopantoate reductase family protein n=1 Tax=Desulfogranum marinum TaxID=453220 RepID=UPI0019646D57|nr:2-dehydropantoate 2-reductase [Desulfogranum marinum]MBM9511808.1 2-dehydropantoate 2-reductase [Desulfogranum marinum]
MRVIIFGAGAMGCLFGAWLSRVAEVVLYDIQSETVESISNNGVVVTGIDGTVDKAKVEVINRVEQFQGKADLAVVFTKSHATKSAAQAARTVLSHDGVVVTLQNGVGNVEQIDAVFGCPTGVAGITAQAANTIGPGHTRHAGIGMTWLAGSPGLKKVEQVQQLFQQAGIECGLSEDAQGLIWGKLLVNVGINALTALLRVHNGVLAEVPACKDIMEQAVSEAAAVADALGIRLPYRDPMEAVVSVCRDTAANKASMLQDALRHTVTEIDVINGAIVAKGGEVGVATPVNDLLTRMVKALEATYERRIDEIKPEA